MTIITCRRVVGTKLLLWLPPIANLIHFPIQSSSITVGETEAFSFVRNTISHHKIKYLRFRRHVSTTRMTACHLHTRIGRLLQHLNDNLSSSLSGAGRKPPRTPFKLFLVVCSLTPCCLSLISLYNQLVSVSVQLVGLCWRIERPPDNLPIHVTYIIKSDYAVGTSVQSTPSKCMWWDSHAYLVFSLRFLLTTTCSLILQALMIIGCGSYSIKKSSLARSENSGESSKDLWYQVWQIPLSYLDVMPHSFSEDNYGLCIVLNQYPPGQEFLNHICVWMADCTAMNLTDQLDVTVINQLYAQLLSDAQLGLRNLANH